MLSLTLFIVGGIAAIAAGLSAWLIVKFDSSFKDEGPSQIDESADLDKKP